MNPFSYDQEIASYEKAYSHLGHLNKPVLQVLTVAFGQADEIAGVLRSGLYLFDGRSIPAIWGDPAA